MYKRQVVSSVFEFWLAKEELNLATQSEHYPTRKTSSLGYRSFYISCAVLLLIISSYGLLDSSFVVSVFLFLQSLFALSTEPQTLKHDHIQSPTLKANTESRKPSFKLKVKTLVGHTPFILHVSVWVHLFLW